MALRMFKVLQSLAVISKPPVAPFAKGGQRHRWYDSEVGKWTTRDPIGVSGGVNLYAYTENNPVNGVDTTGLEPYFDVRNYAMNQLWEEVEALRGYSKAFAKCVLHNIVIPGAAQQGADVGVGMITKGHVVWRYFSYAGMVISVFVSAYHLNWCAGQGYKEYL